MLLKESSTRKIEITYGSLTRKTLSLEDATVFPNNILMKIMQRNVGKGESDCTAAIYIIIF